MTSTIGVKKIQYPNGTDILTLDSSGTLAIGGSITSNITTTGTVNTPSINGGQIGGRRNIIINGAMQVAQRGTSQANVGSTTSGFHTLDRFKHFSDGGSAGRLTMSQSTVSDLPGFANALKLDCTTADTSIAASEYFILSHPLEGQDLQQLKKGTSSAEKVTISFYVKGNASATYSLELNDGSRRIGQTFSVTTSWNRVVLTFDGDTSGAIDDDNTVGLYVNFWLHAGTTFSGGTHGTSWAAVVDNQRAGGSTSIFDSTDRTLEITGLQMEVGSQATSFEHRSFGEELQLCKRYFERMFRGNTAPPGTERISLCAGVWYGSTQVLAHLPFSTKRASPTITQSETGAIGFYGNQYFRTSTSNSPFDSITRNSARINIGSWNASGNAGDGAFGQLVNNNASNISIDAEL